MSKRPSILEILERSGSFVSARKGPGQPPLLERTHGDFMRKLPVRVALEVMTEMHRIGDQRGAQAKAIDAVALRHVKGSGNRRPVISKATIKRYVTRYGKHVAAFAQLDVNVGRTMSELDRRTLGFPPDVREALYNATAPVPLLEYLRAHHIDGTCPKDLIDLARSLPPG